MAQNFIHFDLTREGDLFTDNVKLSYKVIGEKPKVEGVFSPGVDIDAKKAKIVMREMVACMNRIYNVRANPNVIGYLPAGIVKELPRVGNCIAFAAGFTDYSKFFIYVKESLLPLLWAIKPGKNSKRQNFYMERYEALQSITDAVMEYIGHSPKVREVQTGESDF